VHRGKLTVCPNSAMLSCCLTALDMEASNTNIKHANHGKN